MKYLCAVAFFSCVLSVVLAASDVRRASTFGYDPDNATAALQKAIDSGAKTVIVDNTGTDWIVSPIRLRSDLELVFAEGVTVRALPGAFKGQNDCLFTAVDCRNLILRGESNARLIMNKKDYQNISAYKWSEWRHLISLCGSENVTVSNLILENSGGDGIYVSTSHKASGCRNIMIDNVTAIGHHRQGISIISVDGLVIRNSKFNATSGTPPAAGIDFEPNNPREWISDCLVENCEFSGNAGAGIMLHLNLLTAKSRPISVQFRNCIMNGNGTGFLLSASGESPVKGNLLLENCRMSHAKFNEIVMNHQQENALNITIRNCILDCRKSNSGGLVISSARQRDVSGIRFDNLRIMRGKQTPVSFLSLSGCGLKDITGKILVDDQLFNLTGFIAAHKPNEELKRFRVESVNLKNLKPLGGAAKNGLPKARFRGNFKFLQYVEAGKELPLHFTAGKVGKSPLQIQITVRDSNGTQLDRFVIRSKSCCYVAKPNRDDVWTFEVMTGVHTLSLNYGAPGQAILADTRTGIFGGINHKFYFMVPHGVRDIAIEVAPDINEPVSSALINPEGKTVASFQRSDLVRQLKYSRSNVEKAEIWCLAFPYAREDFRFRIGAPLLPLVSTAPENLLVPSGSPSSL